ncbi:hypothetical protein MCOR25_010784 [Pyricularia grisea]|nr:hypothetical protein MCOR25_010784 [Pyricularia grisea]
MLDENLPSFQFRPSSDNPDAAVLFFTQNGSEPEPEYVFKRADPISQPACRGNYAAAIVDPYQPGVVYGEVLVAPEWTQPTLSAAEIRAQNGAAAPSSPVVPDAFLVQLYNPDQSVAFKMFGSSGWGKSGGWEFEIPSRSFRMPSASQLDRQQADATVVSDIAPKVMFKWKRDGRLSKDMTCYMSGRSLGRHKSKEPDITIAFLKQGRDPTLTIYEPNMRRVDVEDRKGLDLVLLLGAAVIRDLYLVPRQDPFNMMTETGGRLRKNSRPTAPLAAPTNGGGPVMSGAIASNNIPTTTPTAMSSTTPPSRPPTGPATQAEIDAETARLKAMVEQEEREAEERARREAEEQRRIQEMLEQEERRERQRREAEIAAETERLRQMYGTEGQDLPSARPNLPPRPADPRPGSAGPSSSAQPSLSSWWRGGGTPQQPGGQSSFQGGVGGGSSSVANRLSTNPYVHNAAASVSGFFNRERDRRGEEGKKVRKKRSVHF